MKKLVLLITLLSIIGLSQAQTTFTPGIKANISNHITGGIQKTDGKMNVGASLGIISKIGFSDVLVLQPKLIFHFKQTK